MKTCGDDFVSDCFYFVINIHDYLWNLCQTKQKDVNLCASGKVGSDPPSKKIKQGEIKVSKYSW